MAKYFIILSALMLAVSARPGYNYPSPGGINVRGGGLGISGGGGGFGISGGGFSGGGLGISTGGGAISGGGYQGVGTTGGGYTGGAISTSYGQPTGVGSVSHIHRHIYVYGPPDGDEIDSNQEVVDSGPAQKHYKIIFIKAPTYDNNKQALINLSKQNEEKTLVYVLVKKPEDAQDLEIHTPAPTQPSKPEVYFIKYKTKQEVPVPGPTYSPAVNTGVKPQYGVPSLHKK